MRPEKPISKKKPGRVAAGFMAVLLQMARGFVIFCGVTPPKPEHEETFAVLLFVFVILLVLGLLAFIAIAASGVVVMK